MLKDQENECGHFNTQIKKQITDPLKFPTNLLKSPMLPRKQKTYVVGQQNNISLAKSSYLMSILYPIRTLKDSFLEVNQ